MPRRLVGCLCAGGGVSPRPRQTGGGGSPPPPPRERVRPPHTTRGPPPPGGRKGGTRRYRAVGAPSAPTDDPTATGTSSAVAGMTSQTRHGPLEESTSRGVRQARHG